MMRSGDLLIAAAAVVALSLAASPVLAGAEACPTPATDHIPAAPLPPLNLGTIKDLLLEYHQKYYDIDVAAVFDSAQKYIEQNAAQSKRPALVLDIDETSLTNWPNLLADNFGFVADGSCDVLPKGPCGFNQDPQRQRQGNRAGAQVVRRGKGQRRGGDFHHRPHGHNRFQSVDRFDGHPSASQ
jgi:hypothetical protein